MSRLLHQRLLQRKHDFTKCPPMHKRWYVDLTSSVTTAGCEGKGSTQRKGKRQIPPNSKSTNQHVPANSSLTHSELRTELYEKEGPFTGASSINRSRSRGNRERREWADIRDGKEETLSGRYVGERKMARESLTYFGLITVKRMRPLTHISLGGGAGGKVFSSSSLILTSGLQVVSHTPG